MLNYLFNVELFVKRVLLFITNNWHYDFWVLGLPEADQFKISETNKIRQKQTIAILNKHSQFLKCSIFHSKSHLHSLSLGTHSGQTYWMYCWPKLPQLLQFPFSPSSLHSAKILIKFGYWACHPFCKFVLLVAKLYSDSDMIWYDI